MFNAHALMHSHQEAMLTLPVKYPVYPTLTCVSMLLCTNNILRVQYDR